MLCKNHLAHKKKKEKKPRQEIKVGSCFLRERRMRSSPAASSAHRTCVSV